MLKFALASLDVVVPPYYILALVARQRCCRMISIKAISFLS